MSINWARFLMLYFGLKLVLSIIKRIKHLDNLTKGAVTKQTTGLNISSLFLCNFIREIKFEKLRVHNYNGIIVFFIKN